MRASSNAATGSSAFTIQIDAQDDGTFKAFSPTVPDLPAQTGETVRDANRAMQVVLQDWVTNGCRTTSETPER